MTTASPPRPVPPGADPRNFITEDAFRLAPELLGTPLARPWRRGIAMAIDGVLIAILSNAPGVLLAFAGALFLFRMSGRPVEGSYVRRSGRLMLRFWGAVVLFVGVMAVWDSVSDRMSALDGVELTAGTSGDSAGAVRVEAQLGEGRALSGTQGLRAAADIGRFLAADDEAEARALATRVVADMRRAGMSDDELREMFTGLASSPERPWLAAAADSVIAGLAAPTAADAASPDSLLAAYASAVGAGDSALAAELRPRVALSMAADTLDHLRDALTEERRERAAAERRLEAAQEELEEGPGVLGTLRSFADELGLGIGWAGLYFTAFLTLWKGFTPGKRLLRIRVIRLDGRPIGWWAAFERFGGYAAGVVTGLLGFFQIFWDRNRQAVHDKISETVVIDA